MKGEDHEAKPAYHTALNHNDPQRHRTLCLSTGLADRKRCQEAGIAESARFQTKPELAVQMLERLWKAQIPIAWVVADSVYGGNLDLRTWLRSMRYSLRVGGGLR